MTYKFFSEGNFEYAVANGQATLYNYCGDKKIFVIPETLGGYAVTSIGDRAFSGCSGLKKSQVDA